LSVFFLFQPTVHNHTVFPLPRTFRAIASAFVSFRVRSVEFVSLSSLVAGFDQVLRLV
jgi:hypothetical protein